MTEADRQLALFDRTAIFVREFVLPSRGQVTVYERNHGHFSVWSSDRAGYFHIMAVSDGPDDTARVDYYRRPIRGDFVPSCCGLWDVPRPVI
jgi:hypothetical protein